MYNIIITSLLPDHIIFIYKSRPPIDPSCNFFSSVAECFSLLQRFLAASVEREVASKMAVMAEDISSLSFSSSEWSALC